MKTVVVAGQARKVGKTAVMAALIRALRSLGWTAVKISRHRDRVPHLESVPGHRVVQKSGFLLTEEATASGTCDTGRFLAAGAKRALWLRVRSDNLAEGVQALRRALMGDEWVMIESNSILDHLTPDLCLLVLDSSQGAFKATARRLLPRADAIIQVARTTELRCGSFNAPSGVPVFSVPRDSCRNRRLLRFVRQELRLSPNSHPQRPSTERNHHGSIEQE